MATHYEVLGVEPAASHDEVRRAYLREARRHHPDSHVGSGPEILDEARRRMTQVNAAWSVLGDPAQRRAYDTEIRRRPTRAARTPEPEPDDLHPDYPEWFEPDETPTAYLEEDPDDGRRGPADVAVFVPVGLVAVAAGLFGAGIMLGSPGMFSLSFVLLPVALVAFLAMPLVSMFSRSRGRTPGTGGG
jgi:hypothetical protein